VRWRGRSTNYIQTMMAIDRDFTPRLRELALATVSVASPMGILLADATGLLLQWCLFRALSLGDGWCPFVPAPHHSNGTVR
jgi:hypothetical protein